MMIIKCHIIVSDTLFNNRMGVHRGMLRRLVGYMLRISLSMSYAALAMPKVYLNMPMVKLGVLMMNVWCIMWLTIVQIMLLFQSPILFTHLWPPWLILIPQVVLRISVSLKKQWSTDTSDRGCGSFSYTEQPAPARHPSKKWFWVTLRQWIELVRL